MKIEFDLLANAEDSIERAIELVAWGDNQGEPRRLKQAIQAVAHGLELLLKERLRRVHPSLVWENVDKYPSLNARTVTVDGAMSRLAQIGGLSFTVRDAALIRSIRDTRNAIEHLAWSTTKEEADRIIGQALAFAVQFARDELAHEFLGYRAEREGTFSDLIAANQSFADAFSERDSQRRGAQEGQAIECVLCHAIAVNPETRACGTCGHWFPQGFDDDIPF